MLLATIVVFLSILAQTHGEASSKHLTDNGMTCSKPWFVWSNDTCKCGNSIHHTVNCYENDQVVKIKFCYCMTYDPHSQLAVVGACPYTCEIQQTWWPNGTKLNHQLCRETWNRHGPLCSLCIEGHGPLVYSYNMQCVPCSSKVTRHSIVLFLVSFLLLTVFCLTIITLRISVARPPLSTFILVSQVMASPQYLSLFFLPSGKRFASLGHYYHVKTSVHNNCWMLFATFFGLWNLDLFRSVYPHVCLSSHISTLQAKFLEYLIALFPLAVLLVVYFGIKLYHKGYWIVICFFRPVVSCLARLRQRVNIQTSLVDAFATFIILAINKVGYTSFIILQPVYLFDPHGNQRVRAYADPTIPYFGNGHLPYALTALVLTFVLIVIPLLLLFLYPLRSFQTFLNSCQWQCTTLHIFADSFQGCYKDGTNGTRDYRWFAGLHLLLRFIIIFFYDLSNYYQISSLLMVTTISSYMVFVAVLQPYKKYCHLKMDMLLMFGVLSWCTALSVTVLHYDSYGWFDFITHLALLALASSIPFLFFIGIILHWLLVVKRFHVWMRVKFRQVLLSIMAKRLLHYPA